MRIEELEIGKRNFLATKIGKRGKSLKGKAPLPPYLRLPDIEQICEFVRMYFTERYGYCTVCTIELCIAIDIPIHHLKEDYYIPMREVNLYRYDNTMHTYGIYLTYNKRADIMYYALYECTENFHNIMKFDRFNSGWHDINSDSNISAITKLMVDFIRIKSEEPVNDRYWDAIQIYSSITRNLHYSLPKEPYDGWNKKYNYDLIPPFYSGKFGDSLIIANTSYFNSIRKQYFVTRMIDGCIFKLRSDAEIDLSDYVNRSPDYQTHRFLRNLLVNNNVSYIADRTIPLLYEGNISKYLNCLSTSYGDVYMYSMMGYIDSRFLPDDEISKLDGIINKSLGKYQQNMYTTSIPDDITFSETVLSLYEYKY